MCITLFVKHAHFSALLYKYGLRVEFFLKIIIFNNKSIFLQLNAIVLFNYIVLGA